MDDTKKQVSFSVAILNILILVVSVGIGNGLFKMPLDTSFIVAITAIAAVVMFSKGYKAKEILEYFFDGGKKSVSVMILLMGVGAVIGSWIVSGVVPTLIYYGLKLISPSYFLVSGFLFLCLISFFIGSAYATAGTVGVALMSIGYGMGFPPAVTAGMVLSGAVFGNKISPFADTTNMCIAVTGVDLVEHIKSMLYSVLPIFLASAAIYTYMGISFAHESLDQSNINVIIDIIAKKFVISPLLLIVPALTIVLIIKKMPPVIALLLATLTGAVVGLIFQPTYDLKAIFTAISKGFVIDTGVPRVDSLLNRGGIASFMGIVENVFFLMGASEILQRTGTTTAILEKVSKIIRGSRSLVIANLLTGLVVDGVTGSQYLAIILPGEMFKPLYQKLKIKLTVLSRTLEDSGTIFAFLIPWSLNAIGMGAILGVPVTESYIYAYQLWFSPILCIIFALTGIAIWKDDSVETVREEVQTPLTEAK